MPIITMYQIISQALITSSGSDRKRYRLVEQHFQQKDKINQFCLIHVFFKSSIVNLSLFCFLHFVYTIDTN